MKPPTEREGQIRTELGGLIRDLLDEGGVEALVRLVEDHSEPAEVAAALLVRAVSEERTDRLLGHVEAKLISPLLERATPGLLRPFRPIARKVVLSELDERLPQAALDPVLAMLLDLPPGTQVYDFIAP